MADRYIQALYGHKKPLARPGVNEADNLTDMLKQKWLSGILSIPNLSPASANLHFFAPMTKLSDQELGL